MKKLFLLMLVVAGFISCEDEAINESISLKETSNIEFAFSQLGLQPIGHNTHNIDNFSYALTNEGFIATNKNFWVNVSLVEKFMGIYKDGRLIYQISEDNLLNIDDLDKETQANIKTIIKTIESEDLLNKPGYSPFITTNSAGCDYHSDGSASCSGGYASRVRGEIAGEDNGPIGCYEYRGTDCACVVGDWFCVCTSHYTPIAGGGGAGGGGCGW